MWVGSAPVQQDLSVFVCAIFGANVRGEAGLSIVPRRCICSDILYIALLSIIKSALGRVRQVYVEADYG